LGGYGPDCTWSGADPYESILKRAGDGMIHWRDWVLDGMLVLVAVIVLAEGIAVTYFLIWHVVKFMFEGKGKDER
jgi:hypothetical protein